MVIILTDRSQQSKPPIIVALATYLDKMVVASHEAKLPKLVDTICVKVGNNRTRDFVN